MTVRGGGDFFIDFVAGSCQNLVVTIHREKNCYGRLAVILLRCQAKISVLVLSLSTLFLLAGCGNSGPDKAGKAIDNAVRQLEQFSSSHQVSWYGEPAVDLSKVGNIGKVKGVSLSKGQSAQKTLKGIAKTQLDDFDQAMEQLKSVADKTPGNEAEGKTIAIAKGLYAEMLVYKAGWAADRLLLADSASLGERSQIRGLCLQIEALRSNKPFLSPKQYKEAIYKSHASIRLMQKLASIAKGQSKQVIQARATLHSRLQAAIKKRNLLNETIGNVTRQMANASAKRALTLQKKIAKLEDKRFDVLVRIQKLRTGPIDLDKPINIGIPGHSEILKRVCGIQQLDQERKRLEIRVRKVVQAIESQKVYLRNLYEQIRINGIKSKQLAERLDKLTAELKSRLENFSTILAERNKISRTAMQNIAGARKSAKQAESILKKYFSAVKDASASLKPGTTSDFLTEAKKASPLELSPGSTIVKANLIKAKVIAENLQAARWTNEILGQAGKLTGLSKPLTEALKQSPNDQKQLKTELTKVLEDTLKSCASAAKRARGDSEILLKTQQAAVLYQASVLIPARRAEFIAKAKSILDEVVPKSEQSTTSQILLPAISLKRTLAM